MSKHKSSILKHFIFPASLVFLPTFILASPGGEHGGSHGHQPSRPAINSLRPNRPRPPNKTQLTFFKNKVVLGCNETDMEIYIPKGSVEDPESEEDFNPMRIMYRNDGSMHCRAETFNETHFRMGINIAEWDFPCATMRLTDDFKIKYSNEVVVLDQKTQQIVSLANISCTVQKDAEISVLDESHTMSRVETEWGGFTVKTSFYRSDEYNEGDVLTTNDKPPRVQVGYYIYAKSEITEYPEGKGYNNMTEIVLVDTDCYASKNSEYNSKEQANKHMIIENRCITANDPTVIIQQNGGGHKVKFKFQMFKWRKTVNQYVYVHCGVAICNNKENGNMCSGRSYNYMCHGDTTNFRKKRAVDLNDDTIDPRFTTHHSFGPIIPWDSSVIAPTLDRSREEQKIIDLINHGIDPDNPPEEQAVKIIVAVVASFTVLSFLVIGIVFYRKYLKNHRIQDILKPMKRAKHEIEQGFVFVLRSSTDPVLPKQEGMPEELDSEDLGGAETDKPKKKRKKKKNRKNSKDELEMEDKGESKRKKKIRTKRTSTMREREDMASRHKDRAKDRKRSNSQVGERDRKQSRDRGKSEMPRGGEKEDRDEKVERSEKRDRGESRAPRAASVVREPRDGSRVPLREQSKAPREKSRAPDAERKQSRDRGESQDRAGGRERRRSRDKSATRKPSKDRGKSKR